MHSSPWRCCPVVLLSCFHTQARDKRFDYSTLLLAAHPLTAHALKRRLCSTFCTAGSALNFPPARPFPGPPPNEGPPIRVLPIGGLGEIGMNCMLVGVHDRCGSGAVPMCVLWKGLRCNLCIRA